MAVTGTYWRGADGNYYIRAAGVNGVTNMGPNPGQNQNFMDRVNGGLYVEIDDPNPPKTTTTPTRTTAPTGGGGSTGPVAPVFNEAGARNTQLTIDQLPALLEAALATERTRYENTVGELAAQETAQRGTYDKSTTTNQLNYDSNFMDSIRAGIKGLGGLMNILRGTGAAGGTTDELVRDVVGGVTAQDIRAGADTRDENQTAVDSSMSTFLTDLNRKRRMNEDTFENNQRSVRRDTDTQLQDLYGKMAGFYGDAGRTAEYNDWMGRAGGLTPAIAANSRAQLSAYDTTPVAVQAPQLTAFAEPSQPNVIAAPRDGQVGSGIFTISDRRKRDESRVPVLAGA